MRKTPSGRCKQARVDCFAYGEYAKCLACLDTDFSGDCPFYKTREERQEGHRKAVERLEKIGRYDLISFYGESAEQPIVWRSI